jgi:hypothetical protein
MKIEPEKIEVTVLAGMIVSNFNSIEDEEKIDNSNEQEATEITISGKITDEQNNPLAYVNILAKGTETGTQTDPDGKYQISVEPNSTLVFSYLGFETKEITTSTISNKIDLDLTLIEEWMGEVIITYDSRREYRIAGRKEKVANRKAERREKKAARLWSQRRKEQSQSFGICRPIARKPKNKK